MPKYRLLSHDEAEDEYIRKVEYFTLEFKRYLREHFNKKIDVIVDHKKEIIIHLGNPKTLRIFRKHISKDEFKIWCDEPMSEIIIMLGVVQRDASGVLALVV